MNEVVHTSPTIGSNVEEIVVKNTHFLMWDIGGQESLRSSWNTYYSNTEVRTTLRFRSALFQTFSQHFCLGFLFSMFRLLSGSWCIQSELRLQQGSLMSAGLALSQRSLSERQSWGQLPQYLGYKRTKINEQERQMCWEQC